MTCSSASRPPRAISSRIRAWSSRIAAASEQGDARALELFVVLEQRRGGNVSHTPRVLHPLYRDLDCQSAQSMREIRVRAHAVRPAASSPDIVGGTVVAAQHAYGNPFNGIVFVATSLALVALAVTDTRGRIGAAPRWTFLAGAAMVAFAWVYPHFLSGSSVKYLYAAPVGLVPCPSLSMAIGLSLLAGGGGRRAWRMTLSAVGLLYGAYGVAKLGVVIDIALFVGAASLAATDLVSDDRAGVAARDAPDARG
jgi:hypothetical protein